jgi:hypothetical protein
MDLYDDEQDYSMGCRVYFTKIELEPDKPIIFSEFADKIFIVFLDGFIRRAKAIRFVNRSVLVFYQPVFMLRNS